MADHYAARVCAHLEKEFVKGKYQLLKCEFVKEEGNYYLRVYVDLTPEEAQRRLEERKNAAAAEREGTGQEGSMPESEGEEEFAPAVSIDDCVSISRPLSKWLDKEDFIDEIYTLEVCSRGFLKNEGEQ